MNSSSERSTFAMSETRSETSNNLSKTLLALLNDESGAILSAEAALLGTLGVVGATVGLSTAASSIDQELADVAYAFRSLDQSFSIPEQRSGTAWKAGSQFIQTPAAESIAELKREFEEKRETAEKDVVAPTPAAEE